MRSEGCDYEIYHITDFDDPRLMGEKACAMSMVDFTRDEIVIKFRGGVLSEVVGGGSLSY